MPTSSAERPSPEIQASTAACTLGCSIVENCSASIGSPRGSAPRWPARRATKGGSSDSCPFAAASRKARKAFPKAAGESVESSFTSPPSQRVVACMGLFQVAGEEVYGRLYVRLVDHLVRGVNVAAGDRERDGGYAAVEALDPARVRPAGRQYLHLVGDALAPGYPLDRKEHTSELQSRQYLVCRLL